MSPFDLTGGPFLALYGTLLVLTIIAGFLIPRWLRPEGNAPNLTNADDLAYLAGGKARFADAVVSRLLATRALALVGKDRFAIEVRDAGRTAAERSVLSLSSPMRWTAIQHKLATHAEPVADRLVSQGLLMDRGTAWQLRFWQTSPYLLLIVFGAIKVDVGLSRDKPVGFLTLLLILTAIFALVRFLAVDRRTRGGIEVLADVRSRADRLRRAPTPPETDMAVALFGTTVLVGSDMGGFHTMRTASSSGDGGSSGGDGGGGCGGGGCGGCGGS